MFTRLYWHGYRAVMKLAHRWHWHYAPPIYPDGNTHLWCTWCGFRQTVKWRHGGAPGSVASSIAAQMLRDSIEAGNEISVPALGITLRKKQRRVPRTGAADEGEGPR